MCTLSDLWIFYESVLTIPLIVTKVNKSTKYHIFHMCMYHKDYVIKPNPKRYTFSNRGESVMRRAKTRVSIILVIALVFWISAIPINNMAAKTRKPKLSKTSVTLKQDEQAEIFIKNVSKKKIKKTTIVSPDDSFVDAWVERKTEITLSHGMGFGKIKIPVKVTLKKKIAGKKTYEFIIKVTVIPDEDDTPIIRPSSTPVTTFAPTPVVSTTPTPWWMTLSPTPVRTPSNSTPSPTSIATTKPVATPTKTPLPTATAMPSPTSTIVPGQVNYITTAGELLSISGIDKKGKTYVLKNDIDMSNISGMIDEMYAVLDGNGYTVKNTVRPLIKKNYGKITNLSIRNANISLLYVATDNKADSSTNGVYIESNEDERWVSAMSSILVLANMKDGVIDNCTTYGSLSIPETLCSEIKALDEDIWEHAYIGGISAVNQGVISSCKNISDLSTKTVYCLNRYEDREKMYVCMGGISGYGNVTKCENRGSMIYGASTYGICSGITSKGSVSNSVNYGSVKSTDDTHTSMFSCGISMDGDIISCINNGEIISDYGAYGIGSGNVSYSTNNGKIILRNTSDYSVEFGGICKVGKVYRCVNKGGIELRDLSCRVQGGGIGFRCDTEESCNAGNFVLANTDVKKCNIGGILYSSENCLVKNSINKGIIVYQDVSHDNNLITPTAGMVSYASYSQDGSWDYGKILNCYSSGNLLFGLSANPFTRTENSYFLDNTSVVCGAPLNTLSHCIGESISKINKSDVGRVTMEQRKNQTAFLGFDFSNVWMMTEDGPDLRWCHQ